MHGQSFRLLQFPQDMKKQLRLEILPQPDDTTCGPTCLQAIYQYYGDPIDLPKLIGEIPALEDGGALGVTLGIHALKRGYEVTLIPYNVNVFDPTWANLSPQEMRKKLARQAEVKRSKKLRLAVHSYLEYIDLGGHLKFQDLSGKLLRRCLRREKPVIMALSATYLYRSMREIPSNCKEDDIRGEPVGHFVVLCGENPETHEFIVADPEASNPFSDNHYYMVGLDRLICATLIGTLTYDANILIIEPKSQDGLKDDNNVIGRSFE